MIDQLRQIGALSRAEWLRQLTSPIWAVFLVAWSLVCGLFMILVLTRVVGADLPVGESATGFLFHLISRELALLLIVFLPQLAVGAIAGRRESGRLEHLLIAGLRPGPLAVGSWLATMLVVSVLALPPALIHIVMLGNARTDLGHTLGGIIGCLATAGVVTALSLAVSAWTPSRTAATLAAMTFGILWWMTDHFPGLALKELGLTPSGPIHAFAGGTVDLGTVASLLVVIIGCLQLARCGLWAISQRWPRLAGAGATILLIMALLGHTSGWTGTVTLAGTATASLSEATHRRIADLDTAGGIDATLIADAASRADPLVDGALFAATRTALQELAGSGLRWRTVDPDVEISALAGIQHKVAIPGPTLARPVLVLEHLGSTTVLTADDLATVITEDGNRRLAALHLDSTVLQAAERLAGKLPTIGWLQVPAVRRLEEPVPAERRHAVGSASRSLAADGYRIMPLTSWADVNRHPWDVLVVPGLHDDPAERALQALRQYLTKGGRLLIALDGRHVAAMPRLQAMLAPYGIHLAPGVLRHSQQATADEPPVLSTAPHAAAGPAALAGVNRRLLRSPYTRPLRIDTDDIAPQWTTASWLPLPSPLWLHGAGGRPVPITQERVLLATSRRADGACLTVTASCDWFADGWLNEGGNELLLRGTAHWLISGGEDSLPLNPGGRLRLSSERAGSLSWLLGLGLPLIAIGIGGFTWWWRRRQ